MVVGWCFDEEWELSDPDHDLIATDMDQALSEEESYQETVHGIRSFMTWTHILDMDNSSSSERCPLSQDTLKRWEKLARNSTYICNQASGFSRCLSQVQTSMQVQLRKIQAEQSKEKSSKKTSNATDE